MLGWSDNWIDTRLGVLCEVAVINDLKSRCSRMVAKGSGFEVDS
jgi:hypothetical protein